MQRAQKSVLTNGVRVVTEYHPNAVAAHIGFWFLTGTRDEPKDKAGISHFLEHLVFKGTKKRSSYDIALALEAVGGELNAFTTKEYTCFHSISLVEHLDLSLDVLSDLVFSCNLPADEFKREKKVVLQEISMSKEEYSEYVFDLFMENYFPKSALGSPILGSEESVAQITRQDVIAWVKDRYTTDNMIVTATGPFVHEDFVNRLEKFITTSRKKSLVTKRRKPRAVSFERSVKCASEQAHILFGFPTSSYKDSDRYESYFVSTLLGGGMTSRLYQTLREKEGLAYSLYSYIYTFFDCAISFFYVASDPKSVQKTIDLTLRELEKLKNKGISKAELKLYRTQMKGQILLGPEDLESRMINLAYNEMIFQRQRENGEIVKEIEKISIESVNAYIEKHLDLKKMSIIKLGDL